MDVGRETETTTMIESKKTPEERAKEAVDSLHNKKARMQKVIDDAELASSRADLARKEYAAAQRAAFAKFPEAVEAAGLAPAAT